jgi:uncharacterized protein YbjT (DUF2867 family)
LREEVFPLTEMEQHAGTFAVDAVFCALGTTIKTAGSQEAFRLVDHELPIRAARLALAHGARQYLLVTALGANAKSRVFYNRVKGEVERDLSTLGYPSVTIARPSLLLGPREEHRPGEQWAKRLAFLMAGKYKAIEAGKVARALVHAAHAARPGVTILESREMQRE